MGKMGFAGRLSPTKNAQVNGRLWNRECKVDYEAQFSNYVQTRNACVGKFEYNSKDTMKENETSVVYR